MKKAQGTTTSNLKYPVRTKIAMKFIFFLGAILATGTIIMSFFVFLSELITSPSGLHWLLGLLLAGSILFIIAGIFIRIKNKNTWTVAVIILAIDALSALGGCIYAFIDETAFLAILLLPAFLSYLVPLVIIVVDRKNYFAMLRQREPAKNKAATPTVGP